MGGVEVLVALVSWLVVSQQPRNRMIDELAYINFACAVAAVGIATEVITTELTAPALPYAHMLSTIVTLFAYC